MELYPNHFTAPEVLCKLGSHPRWSQIASSHGSITEGDDMYIAFYELERGDRRHVSLEQIREFFTRRQNRKVIGYSISDIQDRITETVLPTHAVLGFLKKLPLDLFTEDPDHPGKYEYVVRLPDQDFATILRASGCPYAIKVEDDRVFNFLSVGDGNHEPIGLRGEMQIRSFVEYDPATHQATLKYLQRVAEDGTWTLASLQGALFDTIAKCKLLNVTSINTLLRRHADGIIPEPNFDRDGIVLGHLAQAVACMAGNAPLNIHHHPRIHQNAPPDRDWETRY